MKRSGIFKISLLSISLLSALAQAVSAAFPVMYEYFPNESEAAIETLGTVPNFGCLFGLVVSPFIIRISSKKVTVTIGLILALVSGIFPMFSNDYLPILISRVILGFGIGLFASLAVSMIADYFEGKELSTMLGFQNAMGSIGSGVCSFAIGYLLIFGWHAAFSIYLIAIPALILFNLFVPSDKKTANSTAKNTEVQQEKTDSPKQRLTIPIFIISAILFCFFVLLVPMSYKMPQLVVSKGIGTASDASMIYGIFTLIGIPVSIAYGYLRTKLGEALYPISIACLIVGFGLMSVTTQLPLVYILGIINGVGFGLAVPFGYNWISETADSNSVNLATTAALLSINMGVFLSPTIMNGLGQILVGGEPDGIIRLSSIGFIGLLVIILFVQSLLRKKKFA